MLKFDKGVQKRTHRLFEKLTKTNFFSPVRSLSEANSILPELEETVSNYRKSMRPWAEDDLLSGADTAIWNATRKAVKSTRREFFEGASREATSMGTFAAWYSLKASPEQKAKETWYEALNSTRRSILRNFSIDAIASTPASVTAILIHTELEKSISKKIEKEDESIKHSIKDLSVMLGLYMELELVSDQKEFSNNPFIHQFKLYQMGLKPTINYREGKQDLGYTIDIPLEVDGRRLFGCYLPGDGEVIHTHKWESYCDNFEN